MEKMKEKIPRKPHIYQVGARRKKPSLSKCLGRKPYPHQCATISMVSCQNGPTRHAYADRALLAGYPRFDVSKAFDTINRETFTIVLQQVLNQEELHLPYLLKDVEIQVLVNKTTGKSSLTKLGSPRGDLASAFIFIVYLAISLNQNGSMMTSSNGNIFRVTGHFCGEFTDHRWILRTKASGAELWCFLSSVPE